MRLHEHTPVHLDHGPPGHLTALVVDPVRHAVTHLVVDPPGDGAEPQPARLASLATLGTASRDDPGLRLLLTADELIARRPLEGDLLVDLARWTGRAPSADEGHLRTLAWPFFAGEDRRRSDAAADDAAPARHGTGVWRRAVASSRGSVVLDRRGTTVGTVEGLVVGRSGAPTHVVLAPGHRWGPREVTVPVDLLADVGHDAVVVGLDEAEIGSLPPVRVRRPTNEQETR